MKFTILNTVIASALIVSCSSPSDDSPTPKRPGLSITEPIAACIEGKPFIIDMEASTPGESQLSLSTILLTGAATINIEGVNIPIDGEWFELPTSKVKIEVTLTQPGELIMSFQLKAFDGLQGDKYIFKTMVQDNPDINTVVRCDPKLINPNTDTRIPIEVVIEKPGYEGNLSVTTTFPKGQGKLYDHEGVVYNTNFTLPSGTSTIYYHPQVLGEHILEFTIQAEGVSTVARAYIEVVKNIVVICDIPDSYKIAGIGEHSIQHEEVVLKMANNSYNFEIEGWYDSEGNLLSKEQQYPLTMSCYCLDTLKVTVGKRIVDITRTGIYKQPLTYPIYSSNGVTVKTVYQGRAEVWATYNVTDKLVFYYEKYCYNMLVLPPVGIKESTFVTLSRGNSIARYFFRIDNNFRIYLRKVDNPGLTFNIAQRYVESSNTKYVFSDRITLQ